MIQPLQQIRQLRLTWQALPIRWGVLVGCALLLAAADGFWLTAVQGAIGVARHGQPPVLRWFNDSSILFLGCLLAFGGGTLILAPLIQRYQKPLTRFALLFILIGGVGSGAAILQAGMMTVGNYRAEIDDLQRTHGGDTFQSASGNWVGVAAKTPISYAAYCDWRNIMRGQAGESNNNNTLLLQREYTTFSIQFRAFSYNIGLVLISNTLITLIVLLFLGEYLWVAQPKPSQV
ncbi:MAG: hypothetical protein Fur005_33930 [Roseiflexaceae bacterium]